MDEPQLKIGSYRLEYCQQLVYAETGLKYTDITDEMITCNKKS